jgi:hypothetical protein
MPIVAQKMKKFSEFYKTVFHKSTLLNPVLNKRNPIYILILRFFKIYFNLLLAPTQAAYYEL